MRPADLWFSGTVALTLGAVATCVALAPGTGGSPDLGLAWLLFVGSSVHVASTGWLFTNAGVRRYAGRRRARYVWSPLGLVTAGAALSVTTSPRCLSWVVLLVLAWQFRHFQKQNLGLVALTGASLGLVALTREARAAIGTAGAAGVAEVCAHPQLVQLDVRLPFGASVAVVATALLAVAVAVGALAVLRRPKRDRPPRFCIMYGLALLFPLPLFVCTSPYAAVGGLTVAHGLQYLFLMGLMAAGDDPPKRAGALVALGALAVLGGVSLNVMSHFHGDGQQLRLFFGVYLGLLAGHFVVDAGMWRLREPFVRSFLSARVGFLVSADPSRAMVSVADRSGTDI